MTVNTVYDCFENMTSQFCIFVPINTVKADKKDSEHPERIHGLPASYCNVQTVTPFSFRIEQPF